MNASQTRIKDSIAEKGVTIDVGAGLLANAVGQLMDSLADTPHSRASPLPHLDLHLSEETQSALEKNSAFDSTTQVGY